MTDNLSPALIDNKNVCMYDLGGWLGDGFDITAYYYGEHKCAFYRNGLLWEGTWNSASNILRLTLKEFGKDEAFQEMYQNVLHEVGLLTDGLVAAVSENILANGIQQLVIEFYWDENEM